MENKEMQKLFGSMLAGNKEEKSLFNFKPQEPTKPKSGGRKLTSALLNRIKRSATAAQTTTRETETFVEYYSGRDVEFTDVLYDEQNNRYIATTLNGVIATSTTGYDWEFTEVTIPAIRSIKELEVPVWGIRFVACGTSTSGPWIGLSVDGLVWQQYPIQLAFTPYRVVTYTSNNVSQYVVVGEGGNACFSETSTIRNIGSAAALYDVIRWDNKIVAVGENGTVAISEDLGVNWDLSSSISMDSTVNSIITTERNGYPLLAVGANGTVALFNDVQMSWKILETNTNVNLNKTLRPNNTNEISIVGDNGTFLGNFEDVVVSLYDLIPSLSITTNLKAGLVEFNAPIPFLLMGDDGKFVAYELIPDEIFEEHYSGRDVEFTDVLYDKQNGRYLATTLNSAIATSVNGYDWEFVDIDVPSIYAIKELPNPILGLRFMACGVYNSQGWLGISVDGLFWQQFPLQLSFIPYSLLVYGDSNFSEYVVAGQGGNIYASELGTFSNVGLDVNLYDSYFFPLGAGFVIVGERGSFFAGSGIEYVNFSINTDSDINSLGWIGTKEKLVLVAGEEGVVGVFNDYEYVWTILETNTIENLNKIIGDSENGFLILGNKGIVLIYDFELIININDIIPSTITTNLKTGLLDPEAPLEFLALGDDGKFVTIKQETVFSKLRAVLTAKRASKI